MLSAIFSLAAPAILGPLGMSPMIASAIGGGIGSLLQGGDTQDALRGAALGGLGGFLGGQLGGAGGAAVDPAMKATQAVPYGFGTAAGTAGGGAATAEAIKGSIPTIAGTSAYAPMAESGIMSALTRPEAIGAGLGGLMADSMIKPEYEKKEKKIYPEGMAPEDTVMFPKDRDPNDTSEFDYRFSPNYMAEGGEIESMMSPMDAGIGGMMADGDMNDKELISSAIDVLQGEIIDTNQQNVILAQFVQQFGQEALKDLMQRVQSGEIPKVPSEGDGMIEGAGDGMSDMVPASMEGDQDVLLSDGEFVVPADVVSGIGNGSSDAGSNKLEDMMDRVRQLRTGGTTQPPAIPDEMMLPA